MMTPETLTMFLIWRTLQDEAAPKGLAAIRVHDQDIVVLRLAPTLEATLVLAPSPAPAASPTPTGQPDKHIHAFWLNNQRRLFLTRISILAFLAFLSELPHPQHQEPEDAWIAKTLRRYDFAIPGAGQWQRVNTYVWLRPTPWQGQQIKVSLNRKINRWQSNLLTDTPGGMTISHPDWLQPPSAATATSAEAIEFVEQALILHALKRATPQEHQTEPWILRQGCTWVPLPGALKG